MFKLKLFTEYICSVQNKKLIFEEIKNTTIMKVVELTMTDILNETKVIRQIDLSNIFTGHKPATKENQEDLLKNWIETRGNQQHETILELESWEIVNK